MALLHVASFSLRKIPASASFSSLRTFGRRLLSSDKPGASVLPKSAQAVSFSSTTTTPSAAALAAAADSMPRYANASVPGLLRLMDWSGTGLFAFTGAITAASSGMDLLGTIVVGTITGVGGGTARDAILMSRMPFWVEEWEYIIIALTGALAAFFTWPTLKKMGADDNSDAMLMADGVALGAFAVIGTQNGIRALLPKGLVLVCAMMTSTFGGLTRDVLCQRPPRILHAHADIYATTALAGSVAYLCTRGMGLSVPMRIGAGVVTTAATRMYAWKYGVRLPTWDGSELVKN